ncbi:MAG: hypothetical protein NC041_05200 [Bacteroides sp.]|nr:hypothetical protein [Prevotella sp.]MCM1407355.1 hypothetical protein [Treponema brennaborense]MCM1469845.1 hypothetical protein [Bacteroides sp.]
MNISRENRKRNAYMLKGSLKKNGYDFWRHVFTGYNKHTGEAKTFFIEYFIVNPGLSPDNIVLGQSRQNDSSAKSARPSYVMIKAGVWGKKAKQMHGFFPCRDLQFGKRTLELRVGNCFMSETAISGSVSMSAENSVKKEYMSDAGFMQWDLKLQKNIPYSIGYLSSWFFRKLHAADMNWHVQGIKTLYSGTVMLDGEEYVVKPGTSFGYAGKSWGCDFINPWLWLSCCKLKSVISDCVLQDSCFVIGGGTPVVFGREYKRSLLVFLFHEGKKYEFSPFSFFHKNAVSYSVNESNDDIQWTITAQNKKFLVDFAVACKKSDMLFLLRESPAGIIAHRNLWSGANGTGEVRIFKKVKKSLEILEQAKIENCGCEYGEYHSQAFAAAE